MIGYASSVRGKMMPCTQALLEAALDSKAVASACGEIEDALEALRRGEMGREDFETKKAELKRRLPIITPHAAFPSGRRVAEGAVPSGLSIFDIDHITDPRGFWTREVEHRAAELGIVFAHVTPSTQGLRLVFRMPRGTDLEGAQRWMAECLKIEAYDACVKDLPRCSFIVPRSYVLLLDASGLLASSGEKRDAEESEAQPTLTPSDGGELPSGTTQLPQGAQEDTGAGNRASGTSDYPPAFCGVPYSRIIERWFEMNGGKPVKGVRNDMLHRLAAHLRNITDNSEELLLHIMPRFGLREEEMRALIHSACSSKFCGMSRMMRSVLHSLGIATREWEPGEETNEAPPPPPEMPGRLPSLIKLLLSKTPDIYKPAVAHAVFPALGAHLCGVRFRYIDNVEHEATLMNVLMAETGAGKSCIDEPIRHIMADIRERDRENLVREREWKEEVNLKGANKDKRARPEGLVIQTINPDMTNPAFVMRLKEAEGHFLYAKMNEIDMFDALKGSSRGGQQFQIMCLAFDPGNTYGQTRVGTQSVTEDVTVRFNWNASTTVMKGRQYFRSVVADGPISRINFCTIPERPIGAPMPVYGRYDGAFAEALRPYVENLVRARGLVEHPGLQKLAKKLAEECMDFAMLTQNRIYENLSFRANVIAWLKACVLYVANGCKWEREMEGFIRWSLNYDLWCKMHFFGAAIEEAERSAPRMKKPGPRNLLDLLPEEFSLGDLVRMRRGQGLRADAASAHEMVYNWIRRNHVEELEAEIFRKKRRN